MKPKLPAGPRPGNTPTHEPDAHPSRTPDLARLVARLLAPLVAEELAGRAADDWIDQRSSPLGRRRHVELARAGAFPAHKEGRRWLVRRAELDAYIGGHRSGGVPLAAGPANDHATDEAEDRDMRALLREHGLELLPKAGPARMGRQ